MDYNRFQWVTMDLSFSKAMDYTELYITCLKTQAQKCKQLAKRNETEIAKLKKKW